MPLMKYFGYVGSALALLLIGISWCLPQTASESIRGDKERPTIRTSSAERVPERVDIDTTLPTIVPPLSINSAAPTTLVKTSQPRIQADPAKPKTPGEVLKTKRIAKREAAKKVVAHRAAQPLNIAPAPTQIVQSPPPDARMSLLETLKERLSQALFKLN